MISADLQSLISAHNQSSLAILLMLQQSNITCAALLPLVGLTNELEELCAHLEGLLFELLVGLDVDFLSEANDGLEVNVLGFWGFVLLCPH